MLPSTAGGNTNVSGRLRIGAARWTHSHRLSNSSTRGLTPCDRSRGTADGQDARPALAWTYTRLPIPGLDRLSVYDFLAQQVGNSGTPRHSIVEVIRGVSAVFCREHVCPWGMQVSFVNPP